MNTKKSTSGILFGLTLLVGLIPLAFTFSQNGTQLLLETEFRFIVWCGQAITLLILLLTKHSLSKNQLIGLSVLYVFVPLTFTFNENGVYFLILNKYTSSILSWGIASVLLGKLLFSQKQKQISNF
jgi:intracellular septation protein A